MASLRVRIALNHGRRGLQRAFGCLVGPYGILGFSVACVQHPAVHVHHQGVGDVLITVGKLAQLLSDAGKPR